MISEQQFMESAATFLRQRLGEGAAAVDADTELIESGLLDSLLVLEFFFFLEELTGTAIDPAQASAKDLASLRTAYRELVMA
ncbi:hypothetical protein IEQ44_08325 [Nocardioides sp. Y6]|uniref:Acyl carrier protein n=1 Tax=Nocardioides malaquae TaxID=2773426 RepID=A0ABR9RSW6_9ACTN|nr:hypothetical protein [Nocardioides malaquae]MBE7324657.1 hypothetical protein [Nocardioides malaquae]